jgi:hypothetical protein
MLVFFLVTMGLMLVVGGSAYVLWLALGEPKARFK